MLGLRVQQTVVSSWEEYHFLFPQKNHSIIGSHLFNTIFFLLVSNINWNGRHHIRCICYRHPPSEVLMSAPILTSLSRRNPISTSTLVYTLCTWGSKVGWSDVVLLLICWICLLMVTILIAAAWIEVLGCVALLWLLRRASVKVIEHQVHVGPLLFLKVIDDCLISMNLYLDVTLSLPWKCTRLMKLSLIYNRLFLHPAVSLMPLSLLLLLLKITNVECLSANSTWNWTSSIPLRKHMGLRLGPG